uniref:Uncharacterized protein n=1 Tax=Quercus lobata TaxID=97700 RepID=A0A7N2MH98_QUELO
MRKTVGPDDQSITFPMLHLAVTLYNLKRDEEAEQLALEVLHIREKAFGKDCLPVGEALDCLVSIQTRLGNDDGELLELLKRIDCCIAIARARARARAIAIHPPSPNF